ncbi:hypothetical protein J6590_033196 [Homalodisca vitripennis]|nr:hypothetical protein J6590_033196 [Homalodisca vitripennis]
MDEQSRSVPLYPLIHIDIGVVGSVKGQSEPYGCGSQLLYLLVNLLSRIYEYMKSPRIPATDNRFDGGFAQRSPRDVTKLQPD